ncbi:hypothetical protein [Streptomyces sp. NPDC006879]|uniref:hypothetical protein n=1 Tax=Streptomyces sp. NPDC006879 TaxID=3364767 RepID=UPI0036C4D7E1
MLVTGLVLSGTVLGGTPAQAASACAGRVVKTLPFATGKVRVHRTRTHVCAVTLPRRPGRRQYMEVSIQPRGGVPVRDAGRYFRLAGPVTVHAVSRCVLVKGKVGTGSVSSGWILC